MFLKSSSGRNIDLRLLQHKGLLCHLQLRNTSDPECGLSPAETVFGHPLRNAFLFVNRLATFFNRFICHTRREAWRAKEHALRVRAKRTNDALRVCTHPLRALRCADRVFIQYQGGRYPHKWDRVGTVVEALDFESLDVNITLKWEDLVV